jgi:hypothetical protein
MAPTNAGRNPPAPAISRRPQPPNPIPTPQGSDGDSEDPLAYERRLEEDLERSYSEYLERRGQRWGFDGGFWEGGGQGRGVDRVVAGGLLGLGALA